MFPTLDQNDRYKHSSSSKKSENTSFPRSSYLNNVRIMNVDRWMSESAEIKKLCEHNGKDNQGIYWQ